MRRLFWIGWWSVVLFVLGVLACLAAALAAGHPAPTFGNRTMPAREASATKIAVFGDTQKGIAAFGGLGEIAKSQGIDLALHTGDLVSRADAGHFDLALLWLERARFQVPFVVAPGNHDIKEGGGLFERRIGARQFAFRWGPVDIVVVDNAVAPPGEAAVERLLAAAKGPILLFMHVPPNDTTKSTLVPKSSYNCFLEMIRKYPVRYVFSGHAHDYTRVEDNGIVFIANGVGGDSESWQFDQKAYLTILEAKGSALTESVIVLEPIIGIWANVEHLAIGHVGEIMLHRAWGFPGLALLVVALFLGFRLLRKKRNERAAKDGKPIKFTPAKTSEPPDIVI